MVAKHLIILFDINSTLSPPAWSPNVWCTRFVLNYKHLPYATQWIPYPDVTDVLSAVSAPPPRTEKPLSTVPAILDSAPDREPVVLTESSIIADHLEEAYPEPSIYPGGSRDAQLGFNVIMNMAFMVMPNMPYILEGREREYFMRSRKEIFGIALEDMFPPEKQETMWDNLENGLDELSTLIDNSAHKQKWIFSTEDGPAYADFVLGSLFMWLKLAGPEGGWDRVKGWHGSKWARLFDGLQPYIQVNGVPGLTLLCVSEVIGEHISL
ncbi:hypothetical protein DAEQUDRAFT_680784 [Daedalea quercina L-15889]|uniref:GST N-terminal domain-containing protein n=1 Tax=Daedalea quercina L-15889 TaxID=1314783 RepID=A0A165KIY0_9APHY|nr:hypothetical protein DAEQUDRAFT_680784 [Daedalea quercina L-15889]